MQAQAQSVPESCECVSDGRSGWLAACAGAGATRCCAARRVLHMHRHWRCKLAAQCHTGTGPWNVATSAEHSLHAHLRGAVCACDNNALPSGVVAPPALAAHLLCMIGLNAAQKSRVLE